MFDLGWNELLILVIGECLLAERLVAVVVASVTVVNVAASDNGLRALSFALLHDEEDSHVELALVAQQRLDELSVPVCSLVYRLEKDSHCVLQMAVRWERQRWIMIDYLLEGSDLCSGRAVKIETFLRVWPAEDAWVSWGYAEKCLASWSLNCWV